MRILPIALQNFEKLMKENTLICSLALAMSEQKGL